MTARTAHCPSPEALEAAWPTAGPALQDHLDGCAACAAEWAQIGQLARLGAHLPDGAPGPARASAVRDAVLTGALTAELPALRPRRWLWVAAAALVVGGASAATWYTTTRAPDPVAPPPAQVARHRVEPHGESRFRTVSEGPDTQVEVQDGTVRFAVGKRAPGERYRVTTADGGEVEVRGTSFEVSAEEGRLRAVRVFEGVVAVRPARAEPVELRAGDVWRAAARPPARPPRRARERTPARRAPRAPPSKAARPATRPASRAPAPPPAEGPSIAARLMKLARMTRAAGQPAKAAVYYERALAAPGAAQIAEAAQRGRGLAWAEARRPDRAIPALRAYLAAHPRAAAAPKASLALGRQLAAVGRAEAARAALVRARTEGAPAVAQAAQAELAKLPPAP